MTLSPAARTLGNQPAFPVPMVPIDKTGGYCEVREIGLTKREHMAVEMAKGFCSNSSIDLDLSYEKVGEIALKQADALLEALAKAREEQK